MNKIKESSILRSIEKGAAMKEQNFSNYKRYVPGFHFVLSFICLVIFAGSIFYLWKSCMHGMNRIPAAIIFLISISLLMFFVYARQFALKAQDRAIRAEENLRHFAITGKVLDPRLTMSQIIALRFASDLEFVELANRAVTENMSKVDILKVIKTWRPDYHRA
jgi:hypothetical protein